MKRRRFLSLSGATISSGVAVSGLQKPSIGLNFELTGELDKQAKNVSAVLISFRQMKLKPKYLDSDKDLDIKVGFEAGGKRIPTKEARNLNFSKGETLDSDKIERRSDERITEALITGIDKQNNIFGTVTVSVNHPDISEKSYRRTFVISSSAGVFDDFEDGALTGWRNYDGYDTFTTITNSYRGTHALDVEKKPQSSFQGANRKIAGSAINPSYVQWYWWEDSNSGAASVTLVNSNGNREISFGSENPSWEYSTSGTSSIRIDSGTEYRNWIKFRVEFDWDNDKMKLIGEDTETGHRATESGVSMANGVDIDEVHLVSPPWGEAKISHRFDNFKYG